MLLVWQVATNIRFNDRYAEKFKGHSDIFSQPTVTPYFLLPLQTNTVYYWLYAGLNDIYSSQHVKLSTTSYSSGGHWVGDVFGGIPVLTNGVDAPQTLYPATVNDTVIDLSNWTAGHVCRSLKGYRGYLIALNVTKGTTEYPYLVKWSHQADPGFLPNSWDHTDPTKDAGEQSLSDQGGPIVDGGTLKDSFIIYRENSIYEMRLIGGRFIFNFRKIFDNQGIYSTRCFVEDDGKHCVLTNDDLVLHNGNTMQSIIDSRTRNTLFDTLTSATNNDTTFLAADYGKNEIWVCYPEGSGSFPTKALVYNYRHNTFGYRDLPGTMDINYGVVQNIVDLSWDSDSDTWDSDDSVWDANVYDPTKRNLLICDTSNRRLFKANDTDQFNAVNYTATLERTGLAFGDTSKVKKINRVWPRIEADSGTLITIYLGAQETIGATVVWDSGTQFTVGTDYKIDSQKTGRLLGIRFETKENVAWKLHGYTMDVDQVGSR